MSYRSDGIVSSGLPSLYDEETAAETADKSLSILSAVTGKEVNKPTGQRKSAMPARTIFLYMSFISTMLGFAYWQYQSQENAIEIATVVSPNPVTSKLSQPAGSVALPSPASTPAPQKKIDAALIETIKEKSATPIPPSVLKPDAKPTVVAKAPLIAGRVEKPGIPPLPASSAETKTGLNEIEKNATPAKEVKESPSPVQVAHTEKTIRSTEVKQANAAIAASDPVQPTQRSATMTGSDPDEKLLEGILRLIKRDRPTDADHGRAAK